jgi:hypothetical protein
MPPGMRTEAHGAFDALGATQHCPQAGIAAAITSKTKFRRLSMPTSPFRGLSTCRMMADCQTGDPSLRPVIDGIKVAIRRSPGNPRTIRYSLPGSARCGHRSQVHRDRSNTDRRCGLGGELQWRRNFEAWEWEQQDHRELDAATKSIAASPRLRPTRSKTSKPAAR